MLRRLLQPNGADGADYEPDDEWKAQLRKRIEESLQSMVTDAKGNLAAEWRKAPDTPETRMRLEADYNQAMQTIKNLASEQYQLELDRERNQRRWTAGASITPGWTQYFRGKQKNFIKQSSQHIDNSVQTAGRSSTEERRSAIPKPSYEPPIPVPSPIQPVPPNSSVRLEGRECFVSPPNVRQGSDARTVSRDEHPGSSRRGQHVSVHENPRLPEISVVTETLAPLPRAPLSHIDRSSQSSPVSPDRWDGYLGRRGSTSSIDRLSQSSPVSPDRWDGYLGKSISYMDRPSQSFPASPDRWSRSLGRSNGSIQSLTFNDRYYPINSPGKSSPYYEYRNQSSPRRNYSHHEQSPSQDQLSARPRSACGGDDRDYGPQYLTPHGPHGPYSESAHPSTYPYLAPQHLPGKRADGNDGYSRHHSPVNGIPISRHTQGIEESLVQPAWRERGGEGNRHPSYDYHQQGQSSSDAIESFSHHRFTQPPPSDCSSSSRDDRPSFDGRETDSSRSDSTVTDVDTVTDVSNVTDVSTVTDEYDSDEDEEDEEEEEEEDDEDDDEEEDGSEDGIEATKQKLEENRREELKRTELEIQRLAAEEARKKEEAERREEMRRKEEDAMRREEEARKKEAEMRRMEEVKKKAEEAARKAEEAIKTKAEAKKREAEAKIKERVAKMREDAMRKEEAVGQKEEDARWKAKELNRKEEEAKQRAAQLDQDTEKTKQMQSKYLKKIEEEALKKDMEMKEREDILRRRNAELIRREADKVRREEEAEREARHKEAVARQEEARKKEEYKKEKAMQEARQKEAVRKEGEERKEKENARRREEEARKEAEIRRMEVKKEDAVTKAKEAMKMEAEAKRDAKEVARGKGDEARRKAEALKEEVKPMPAQPDQDAQKTKQMQLGTQKFAKDKTEEGKDLEVKEGEEETKQKAVVSRQEEARKWEKAMQEARQKEEARKEAEDSVRKEKENARRREDFRREQEGKRLHIESRHLYDILSDLDTNMANSLMHERLEFLRQAGFRKREEDIRRSREERKRNGNDGGARPGPSRYFSVSPGASPGISSPQCNNGPPIHERSPGTSPGGRGAGAPAWGPSIKPTASAPAANRSSFGGRETDSPCVTDEYDADDDTDDGEDSSEDEIELRRLRNLAARLRENRRGADDELKGTESETQQLAGSEARKKKEEEMKRDEARRKDVRRREEEARKKEVEVRRMEEEVKKKEEEERKKKEEATRRRDEARRKEEEAQKKEAEIRRMEEKKKKEEDAAKKAEEATKMKAEAEKLHRAHEKLGAERQLKSADRPLELQRVFEHHGRLWNRLHTLKELSWNDFPWPMAAQPSNPDDMSRSLIYAYIHSPLYPDKSRTSKDRIMDHIKIWHPDSFEAKLLRKVVENEKAKVKLGAGNVARYLSDLLAQEKEEGNNNNMFR